MIGTCIHHASLLRLLFSAFSPMLTVAVTMILATFRALLMTTARVSLLIAPNDLRAWMRAVLLPPLTGRADDETRLAPSASPLSPVHSPRLGGQAENLVPSRKAWSSCPRRFESKARSFRSGPSNFLPTVE